MQICVDDLIMESLDVFAFLLTLLLVKSDNCFMKRIFFEKAQSLKYLFEKVAALENSQV